MSYTKSTVYAANDHGIVEATINHNLEDGPSWSSKIIVYGSSNEEVDTITTRIIDELNGTEVNEGNRYAEAFNMWMDQYVNDPKSFEDSYSTALNHVSEKLLGEEPSYGAVAAEQFKQYLNQLESK